MNGRVRPPLPCDEGRVAVDVVMAPPTASGGGGGGRGSGGGGRENHVVDGARRRDRGDAPLLLSRNATH